MAKHEASGTEEEMVQDMTRTKNWVYQDTLALLNMAIVHKDSIHGQFSSLEAQKKRDDAWDLIVEAVNAVAATPRSKASCDTRLQCFCSNVKMNKVKLPKQRAKTRGGPPPSEDTQEGWLSELKELANSYLSASKAEGIAGSVITPLPTEDESQVETRQQTKRKAALEKEKCLAPLLNTYNTRSHGITNTEEELPRQKKLRKINRSKATKGKKVLPGKQQRATAPPRKISAAPSPKRAAPPPPKTATPTPPKTETTPSTSATSPKDNAQAEKEAVCLAKYLEMLIAEMSSTTFEQWVKLLGWPGLEHRQDITNQERKVFGRVMNSFGDGGWLVCHRNLREHGPNLVKNAPSHLCFEALIRLTHKLVEEGRVILEVSAEEEAPNVATISGSPSPGLAPTVAVSSPPATEPSPDPPKQQLGIGKGKPGRKRMKSQKTD